VINGSGCNIEQFYDARGDGLVTAFRAGWICLAVRGVPAAGPYLTPRCCVCCIVGANALLAGSAALLLVPGIAHLHPRRAGIDLVIDAQ
jgi:hypothetical protein